MKRVQVITSGWTGGPGVSTYYFLGTSPTLQDFQTVYDRVQALCSGLKGIISKSATMHVNPEIDELAETSGEVTNTLAVTGAADVVGTSLVAGLAPPGIAALAQFKSSDFIGGRRVQGHSFISPLGPNALESDGTPTAETTQTVIDNFNVMRLANSTGLEWCIWSRPRKAGSGKKGDLPFRAGSAHLITSVACQNKFGQIRSRRD